jgi:hypothetical protein
MITISLEGNTEAMGLQEGNATKDILERIIWGNLLRQIDLSENRIFSSEMEKAYGEHLKGERSRIEALSQGAFLEPEELYRIYSMELGEVFRLSPPVTSLLIGLSYEKYEGGFPALCVNLDAPFYLHPLMTFKKIYADKEYSRFEFSLITSSGAFFGINEAGLAAGLGLKPFEGEGRGSVPLSAAVSEVLKKCKEVDSAIKLIVETPRGASGMIALADPNKIAVVELTPDSYAVRGERDGFIVSTQHFLSDSLMSKDLPHDEIHLDTSPPELFEKRIYDLSERRFEEAAGAIKEKVRWKTGGLTGVLSSVGSLLYLTEGYYKTSISAVMIPGKKNIYLKEGKRDPYMSHFL